MTAISLDLCVDPLAAARRLLGCHLEVKTDDGLIAVRLVEVEAYWGARDPAAHSFRGQTARNAVMFGPPGHLYVYFIYGMHFCANVVCLPDGEPGAVLLRAGEVVKGIDIARQRRATSKTDAQLAQGPARLCSLLGLTKEHNGINLTNPQSTVKLLPAAPIPEDQIQAGPRVGVSAAADLPWRWWITQSPAVSTYRRGGKRKQGRPAPIPE